MNRLKVQYYQVHNLKDLFKEEQLIIYPKLYSIYNKYYTVDNLDDFIAQVLNKGDNTKLAIFYYKDQIAGFSSSCINTFDINDKEYALFSAGVYFDLKYKGGTKAVEYGLRQALMYKFLHPKHNIGYLAEAANPAAYSLYAKMTQTIYPSSKLTTPKNIENLIMSFAKHRGLLIDDANNLIINYKFPRTPLTIQKSLATGNYCKDQDYQFYLENNPNYQSGKALLVYIPLDYTNIMHGLYNVIKSRISDKMPIQKNNSYT